ncbi:MAG: NAD-binding protein [Planctomycetaceae bacterium]|nr:NAD-binding protein [Planctomycetaceae bacterium]
MLIIALKAAVVWKILRRIGQSHSVALATGLCLSQVGEFAFVLGTAGRDGGVISKEVHMTVVSATIATLFLTPYLVALAPAAGNWLERRRKTPAQPAAQSESEHLHPDVLIIGFGPAGQAIGRALVGKQHKVIVLDVNPQGKLLAESLGLVGQIGDGTQFEVLEHAHVSSAKLVVITLPARSAALTVLQTVKQLAPQAHIVVRSRYQLHLAEFEQAGADAVIGDEEQVGYRLSAYVNLWLTMLADDNQTKDTTSS